MMEQDMNVLGSVTLSQRAAICFASGVVGAVAVVLFSYVLFGLRISSALGVKAPIPLKSPDIYRPLFWRGVLRTSPGADVHALPAAGKSALRDNHRFGCQGDHRDASVSVRDESEKF